MRQAHLKTLRLILAILFIVSTGYIFLDFREILNIEAFSAITYLQFTPSIIKFFAVFSLVSAGFVAVLVLTALFGRVYCSIICPLGILQDIMESGATICSESIWDSWLAVPKLEYTNEP